MNSRNFLARSSRFMLNKVVLSSRSAYFRALFSSEFRERTQSTLPLPEVTAEQLVALLSFIYADDWPLENVDFALDMIPVADRLSVLELKRLCERTLISKMSVDNVAQIFSLADRYSCERLRGRALAYMTDPVHFTVVMKTEGFAELDKQLILEILHSHKTSPAVTCEMPRRSTSLRASRELHRLGPARLRQACKPSLSVSEPAETMCGEFGNFLAKMAQAV